MPFSVVLLELLTELGVGATNSEATRDAAPIFLESGAMFVMVQQARGVRENLRRGAVALRGVARAETRQVYFQAELGFLEGTPLCPSLIYRRYKRSYLWYV